MVVLPRSLRVGKTDSGPAASCFDLHLEEAWETQPSGLHEVVEEALAGRVAMAFVSVNLARH
jgi:hypothetical protein